MPRKRDPRRDEAFEIWKQHKGEITNREIAKQLDVPEKTISAWKSRDKWNAVLQKNKRSTSKRKGGQPGNKNAKGHGAPKQNSNAVKHGLFAKYLPKETLEIVYHMDGITPVDLLWANIEILFAQIIRAQQIMHVESKDEMIKELKKEKVFSSDSGSGSETEWEFQFAWDRQASFLQAQARAMTTLQGLFRQFDESAHRDDERRLKLEQMQLNIDKTKAEIDKINQVDSDSDVVDEWVQAMGEVDE